MGKSNLNKIFHGHSKNKLNAGLFTFVLTAYILQIKYTGSKLKKYASRNNKFVNVGNFTDFYNCVTDTGIADCR